MAVVNLMSENEDGSTLNEWTSPAKLIPFALLLSALWVALGIKSSPGKVTVDEQETPAASIYSEDPAFVDPFSEPY